MIDVYFCNFKEILIKEISEIPWFPRILRETNNMILSNITRFHEFFCENNFKKSFNLFSWILREINLIANNITRFHEFFCETTSKKGLCSLFLRIFSWTQIQWILLNLSSQFFIENIFQSFTNKVQKIRDFAVWAFNWCPDKTLSYAKKSETKKLTKSFLPSWYELLSSSRSAWKRNIIEKY